MLTPYYDPELDDIRLSDEDSNGITYDPYLEEFRFKDSSDGLMYDPLMEAMRMGVDPATPAIITGFALANPTVNSINYLADVSCDIETMVTIEHSLNADMSDAVPFVHGIISEDTTVAGVLGVIPGNTVYVRVKAENAGGTSYSNILQAILPGVAVITNFALSNITETTVNYLADVACEIETMVTIEHSLNEDMSDAVPIIHGLISEDTTVVGILEGLTPGSTIYVRVKAENAAGASFSAVANGGVLNLSWYKKLQDLHSANIVALYPHNELSGTVLNDLSANNLDGVLNNARFNEVGIGDGTKSIKYDQAGSYANIFSAELAAKMPKEEFTIIAWIKAEDSSIWNGTDFRYIIKIEGDANNVIYITKSSTAKAIRAYYTANGVSKYGGSVNTTTGGWLCLALTVSKINDTVLLYVDGIPQVARATGLGTFTPNISLATIATRYASSKSLGWSGWIGPVAILDKVLNANELAVLSTGSTVKGILFIGDSKTVAENWRVPLCRMLIDGTNERWTELPAHIGVSGITTALMKDRTDADILAMSGLQAPTEISINMGANDASGGVLAANYDTNTRYIINAYHTAFPNANIRLTKPWRSTYTAVMAQIGALIDQMYLDYAWLKPGISEFDFLPGADNGATNTSDGVHPNVAGGLLEAQALYNVITA